MSSMGAVTTRLTYEAYLELPEIKQRYDIVDGVLEYMSPSPTLYHQRVLRSLFLALHRFVERGKLGEVYFAPLDIIISKKPLRTRQADLLFISNARLSIGKDQIEGPPDVVVEVLSPGNAPKKLQAKLEDYASLGVPEVWVAAPAAKTLEVSRLTKGKYRSAGICSAGSPVNTEILSGFILPQGVFD
jgi:Uma2 family endonuclease